MLRLVAAPTPAESPWKAHALSSALGLALGAAMLTLFWSRYETPSDTRVLALPPPSVSAAAASRCPPRTLEDHGVCIPVPVTQGQESSAQTELVPLLPGRPTELGAYHLPVSGAAQLTDLSAAEVPPRFRIEGQALAINLAGAAALSSRDLLPFDAGTVVGSDPVAGWLLLKVDQPSPSLVLLAGLVGLMPHLVIGDKLPANGTLAQSGKVFWLSARQLLPAHSAQPTPDAWQASASVATDVRNLLQLKAGVQPAPAASARPQ